MNLWTRLTPLIERARDAAPQTFCAEVRVYSTSILFRALNSLAGRQTVTLPDMRSPFMAHLS